MVDGGGVVLMRVVLTVVVLVVGRVVEYSTRRVVVIHISHEVSHCLNSEQFTSSACQEML